KGETYLPRNVIDNDLSTRWSSEFKAPQWIQLDLGNIVHVERIEILWETAYAVAYTIQISNDNKAWHTVFRTNSGDGTRDEIDVGKEARYVRITCVKRKSKHWGFSIWEIKVFGKKKWTFI
ncbi:MAG: discoidin domain-containing protein, partial [Candidatus Auribacterota bacterium]|nr:discoidin domain-containing protein [Candidatus Auribacterota bacterium]